MDGDDGDRQQGSIAAGVRWLRAVALVPVVSIISLAAVGNASADPVSPEFVDREPEGTASAASAVAEAPGGLHVYATAADGDAINVYSRDQTTGVLTFVQAAGGPEPVAAGCGDKNLEQPTDLAISPDGKHVYATAHRSVFVFSRNVATGVLTFVEDERDACPGGPESPLYLTGASGVAVSPDGVHVYVSARSDDAVTIFSRDPVSGQLDLSDAITDADIPGGNVLNGATDLIVSPQGVGAHVYVSSNPDGPVAVFARDSGNGSLTHVETELPGPSPLGGESSLAIDADGETVYATRYDSDKVAVFGRNPGTGALTLLEEEENFQNGVVDMNRPTGIAISADGSDAYVSSEADSAILHFDRAPAGTLSFVSASLDGQSGVDGLAGASDVLVSGDGENIYAGARVDDVVAAFSRTSPGGAIAFVGADPLEAPNQAAALAVSPEGDHVYVTGGVNSTLSAYSRNVDGTLTLLERERQGVDDLSDAGATVSGIFGAAGVTVSSDGEHVYAAGGFDDAIAIFDRNPATGRLSYVGAISEADVAVEGLDGVGSIAVSADGDHVYATGRVSDSLVVFSRDAGTGGLTFVEAEFDGAGGVDGLAQPRSVTVDGNHVYVAAYDDNAVSVFERDPGTGEVDLVEVEKSGVNDPGDPGPAVAGLVVPRAVTVAPDGDSVYVAANKIGGSGTIAAFDRDPVNGELSFAEFEEDGIDDLSDGGAVADGISEVTGLAVVPDGESVLAVSRTVGVADNNDDSLAVFERDPVTSRLSFAEVFDDGIGGVDGLEDASGIALPTDGGHAYATAAGDDAVAIFDLAPGGEVDEPKLKAKATQKIRTAVVVKLKGGAAEAVSLDPKGKLVIKRQGGQGRAERGKKVIKLTGADGVAAAGTKSKLKLAPSKSGARVAKRALEAGDKLTVKARVKFTDDAANSVVLKKRIRLK